MCDLSKTWRWKLTADYGFASNGSNLRQKSLSEHRSGLCWTGTVEERTRPWKKKLESTDSLVCLFDSESNASWVGYQFIDRSPLLAALKRFISRRGKLNAIYSDNGTNFVGASKKLCQLFFPRGTMTLWGHLYNKIRSNGTLPLKREVILEVCGKLAWKVLSIICAELLETSAWRLRCPPSCVKSKRV